MRMLGRAGGLSVRLRIFSRRYAIAGSVGLTRQRKLPWRRTQPMRNVWPEQLERLLRGDNVAMTCIYCERYLGGSRTARLAGRRSMDKSLMEVIT